MTVSKLGQEGKCNVHMTIFFQISSYFHPFERHRTMSTLTCKTCTVLNILGSTCNELGSQINDRFIYYFQQINMLHSFTMF